MIHYLVLELHQKAQNLLIFICEYLLFTFVHIIQTNIVSINNLGLTTAAIIMAKIFTSNPPKYGIIVVTAANILNTK